MSEPVNIMGVVGVPNEDGKRDCRFIDPQYNKLFTVPDGENVVLTGIDGTRRVLPCAYIDDYHVRVGISTYHICEFAETMHRNGTVYQPEQPNGSEKYGVYEIYQITDLAHAEYLFESYDRAKRKIKLSDYQRVYAGMCPADVRLDDLFVEHNRDTRPFGSRMRSMSVSDIVVVTCGAEKHAWYVDSVGFQQVDKLLQPKQPGRSRPPKKRYEPER